MGGCAGLARLRELCALYNNGYIQSYSAPFALRSLAITLRLVVVYVSITVCLALLVAGIGGWQWDGWSGGKLTDHRHSCTMLACLFLIRLILGLDGWILLLLSCRLNPRRMLGVPSRLRAPNMHVECEWKLFALLSSPVAINAAGVREAHLSGEETTQLQALTVRNVDWMWNENWQHSRYISIYLYIHIYVSSFMHVPLSIYLIVYLS